MLVTCSGLMFLASARDLIGIYISLELSSIPQYILAGWGKDRRSAEAGLKYLLMGAVASSILPARSFLRGSSLITNSTASHWASRTAAHRHV